MNLARYVKLKDIVTIFLIIFVTFFYFALSDIPEGFTSIDLYFFKIGSFGFPDIAHLVHYLKMKFLILSFVLIWYFTCKHWWRSAILVIIAIELSKTITALNSTSYALDEIDYITSLPITIPIIIVLFLISKKLHAYNLSLDLRATINNELDDVFHELNGIKTDKLLKLKQELIEAKENKSMLKDEAYYKKIIEIRDQYYKI